jgi:phosphoserine aminotransferase
MSANFSKPSVKPNCPNFSSGPCAKRPGWSVEHLQNALLGRSHRSGEGKEILKSLIEKHKELLGIPEDYLVGIVPASDTGAIEMAMWSMLGQRGIDVFVWESFSSDWMKDICNHLKLDDVNTYEADYGCLPDLSQYNGANDAVFVWNGTTGGVKVPNGDWIPADREGLTFCDATSAVFAYDMPWDKLDVTTWSWQKVLGGEAAHGMLVLSPRAVERLETYTPPRPLPKIFRMTKNGKVNAGIFRGETINTPSMLAVQDCHDALDWVQGLGGVSATMARSKANLDAIENWVNGNDVFDFLCQDEASRSSTSICLVVKDEWFNALPADEKMPFIKAMCKLLDKEDAAKDIASYRAAPEGLRIWGGATIEASDIEKLLPWLDWAYAQQKQNQQAAQAA